jgi:hypothetical protein
MSERRAPRLIIELAFLVALSAAVTFADLQTYEIAGVMLLGWVLVAVFEWGALRGRPHYGSGSPPRWYIPQLTLPPPRPLEQFSSGYPAADAANDAPTWIASPAMLADWPVQDVEPNAESPLDEQTHVHDALEVELAIAVAEQTQQALPVELDEDAEPGASDDPEPKPRPSAAPRAPRVARPARHRIDPLAAAVPKGRRFARRGEAAVDDAEVPDGPPRTRLLPTQASGED